MKRLFFPILATMVLCSTGAYAQKKPLDHSVYDAWESSQIHKLSKDGSVLAYSVNKQAGDAVLYVRNLNTGAELVIPRGERFTITEDAAFATCFIKAPYDSTRNAKIAKKKKEDMPKDTAAYIRLSDLSIVKLPKVTSVKMGTATAPFIIAATDVPKKSGIHDLLVIDPVTGAADTIRNIAGYEVSRNGLKLAMTTNLDKKDSLSLSSIILKDLASGRTDTLSRDKKAYKGISFNHESDKMLFLATDQEAKEVGTPSYSIFLTEEKTVTKATRKKPAVKTVETRELVGESCGDLPEGWVISDKAGVRFSNSDKRLILSLNPYIEAKDTTVLDFEAPKLDIWRWDAPAIPPVLKRNGYEPKLTAVINMTEPSKVLVLSRNPFDKISFVGGADYDTAMACDASPYVFASQWDYTGYTDVSLIDLRDGSRKEVAQRLPSPQISDFGRYITWFDREEGQWYCYNISDGTRVNLTGSLGVSFVNAEVDTPSEISPYTGRTWFGEDEFMLISDKYDIWKLRPDGKNPVNLTSGQGRADSIQYRLTDFENKDNSHIYQNIVMRPVKGKIYMTAFDENDKRNGLGTMRVETASQPSVVLDTFSFQNYTRGAGSERMVYRKGNFTCPTDVYVSDGSIASDIALTAINPQMKDYIWGKAQLVSWTAYDGTPLKGILYTPENLDPSKKYPMIVYFYEKNTQNLYASSSPAPSRSIINYPYCVSNGYVVFVPDIVYKAGHPGESAYNCIVSGTEAMCEQFPFINRDKMALQGQSWGGYQTAYLVTRTDIYAAAEAGAPVSNMTSAYGGIRWGTGHSRIGQYEHGQSRIGKTLWDEGGLDLYIENSPVFFADKIKTPLMIMSNDNDGAVPWYQGIEYFMALRRLGKPCWLLEYNNEAHNLNERRNSKDLSIRMMQFFDHFLKDAPAPSWMTSDIPQSLKGNKFGYELEK